MIRDYSKSRLFWTKHAVAEALEDNFDISEIQKNLGKIAEIPEFNEDKKRGVLKAGNRHCTLIYKKKKHGLIITTCWESSQSDVKEYNHTLKKDK